MLQRTFTDIVTGVSLASSYFWFDQVVYGAQGILVLGGVVIMVMRGWLLWKDIKDRRNDDGNS